MSSIIKYSNLCYENQDPIVVTCDTAKEIYKANEKELKEKHNMELRSEEQILLDKLDKLEKEIDEAEAKYQTIIQDTSKQILDANKKVDKLLEDAKVEGIRRGMQEGKNRQQKEMEEYKAKCDQEINNKVLELEQDKKEFLKNAKDTITDIVKDSFEKMFNVEVKESSKVLNTLVLRGLRELTDEKEVRVIFSEEDYQNFNKELFLNEIKGQYDDKVLSFSFDKSLGNGSCLVETSLGFIDSSVNNLAESVSLLISSSIN
ncbi:MAG: hypothetical protein MJ244_03105 [Clostridia bacterium]|nr:hypothetical protein [Clostridia bacterium]